MPVDTTVKYFHSGMAGAPTLNGTAGAMIALLDACLVNGFGSGTVDSVVIASGVATVTRAAGHPMEVGAIASISGATVSGGSINGEQKVLSVGTTTYTFDATGLSDQTATGTITHKLAPAGWTKAFSGTNLAAYKSSNVAATGCYLRVDDTGTTNARLKGFLTMSDVNTGTGEFPTTVSGGQYLGKSSVADSSVRAWRMFADDRGVYLRIGFGTVAAATAITFFGDINSKKPTDPYRFGIIAGTTSYVSGSSAISESAEYSAPNTSNGFFLARGVSGIGSAVAANRGAMAPYGNNAGMRSGEGQMHYPNPADNGVYLTQMLVSEATNSLGVFRGEMPGIYFCPHNLSGAFADGDRLSAVEGLTGKTLMATKVSTNGAAFFDITGPWG